MHSSLRTHSGFAQRDARNLVLLLRFQAAMNCLRRCFAGRGLRSGDLRPPVHHPQLRVRCRQCHVIVHPRTDALLLPIHRCYLCCACVQRRAVSADRCSKVLLKRCRCCRGQQVHARPHLPNDRWLHHRRRCPGGHMVLVLVLLPRTKLTVLSSAAVTGQGVAGAVPCAP